MIFVTTAKLSESLGNINSIYTWKTRYLELPEGVFVGSNVLSIYKAMSLS